MASRRPLLLCLSACLLALPAWAGEAEAGRAIYQEGRLPGGAPLAGLRFGNEPVRGEAAACVGCHRKSGMGAVEGDTLVPPVTGKALFEPDERVVAVMDPRRGKAFNQAHPPYTPETLARALRQGIDANGRAMSPLMPRYELSDAEIAALAAYLRELSAAWSPGVSATQIRLATVIAPGVDAKKKAAFLAMAEEAVQARNRSVQPGRRYMASAAELMLRSGRRWQLSVWELEGPPETWAAQLERRYRENPVFAIVSGLSQSTWAPVDAFCQQEGIPCLFPSVDAAPAGEGSYYPVYFSRGVLLEADVLAAHLRSLGAEAPGRIVQIHADGFAGRAAARRLEEQLRDSGLRVDTQVAADGDGLRRTLAGLGAGEAAVLWLPAGELAPLAGLPAPPGPVFFSGRLLDGEPKQVPAAWRAAARLVYPYELPHRRRGNLASLNAWLKQRRIEPAGEPFQSEVFFAFSFAADVLSDMLNNLYRDYLIERTENMVAFREGSKAEQEVRDRAVLGRSTLRGRNGPESARPEARELLQLGQAEQGRGEQGGTTVYPRLSLGAGQRFASKGAYIARFASPDGDTLVNTGGWLVP